MRHDEVRGSIPREGMFFLFPIFLSSSSAISSNVGDPTILYHQVIRGLVKQASIVRHLFLSHYPLYVFHGDLALPIGATTHHHDS